MEYDKLLKVLPESWQRFKISQDGHLQHGGTTYATVLTRTEEEEYFLPLLGDDLGIAFSNEKEGWKASASWLLQKAQIPDMADGEAFRLELPGAAAALGGRLGIVLDEGGHLAVVLRPDGLSALEVVVEKDTKLQLDFRLAGMLDSLDPLDPDIQFELPLQASGPHLKYTGTLSAGTLSGGIELIRVDAARETQLRLEALQELLKVGELQVSDKVKLTEAVAVSTSEGAADWLSQGGLSGTLTLDDPAEDGILRLRGFVIEFLSKFRLEGTLDVGLDLRVKAGASCATLQVKKRYDLLPESASPFTCVIHEGTTVQLAFSPAGWRIDLDRLDGGPAATVLVPGVASETLSEVWATEGRGLAERLADLEKALPSHFVLDLVSEDGRAPLSAASGHGLRLRARARERPIEVGLLEAPRVTGGTLEIDGSEWQLAVDAEAGLPWFQGSRGAMRVRGGRTSTGGAFGAAFDVEVSDGWTDPSGLLTVNNPTVSTTLDWEQGQWQLGGGVSGTLVFNRAPFVGDAKAWLGELFRGAAVEFNRIDLSRLSKSIKEGLRLRVTPKRALRIPMWDVFQFELTDFSIGAGASLDISGLVGFSLGEVRFGGTLPDLRISLAHGRIEIDPLVPLAIRGFLEAPSGVRVEMGFSRESKGGIDILKGYGSIKAPTIPDVDAMVRVGRFKTAGGDWRPTLAVNGDMAVNKPIMTGVVAKRIGLGFGIYQTLRGLEVETVEEAFDLLSSGRVPAPSDPDSWRVDEGTAFSLVGRSMLSATNAPHKEPDFYVADLVISLDTQLRIAAFGLLWMLTSPDDARTAKFRERPFARGMTVINVVGPSLLAAYASERNPKMSLDDEEIVGPAAKVLGRVLGAVDTRASLEARPGYFDLTLGPTRVDIALGPFQARGSTLFAVRASEAGSYALATASLSADFEAGNELRFGPATVGIHAEAGFALEATLYGGIRKMNGETALVLAADLRADAYAALAVSLKIEFRIRIKTFLGSVTIRFSKRWRIRLKLQVAVGATLALATNGVAFKGSATVRFSVMGVSVRGTLPISAGDEALLNEARQAMHAAKQPRLTAPSA